MIKRFENFFAGNELSPDSANFNSTGIKGGTNMNVQQTSSPVEIKGRINNLKEEICLEIAESNLDLEDLRKIQNFLKSIK